MENASYDVVMLNKDKEEFFTTGPLDYYTAADIYDHVICLCDNSKQLRKLVYTEDKTYVRTEILKESH